MMPLPHSAPAQGTMPARKPRILLAGEFSTGKTRLVNGLLGEAALPSNVTATALPPVWVLGGNPLRLAVPRDGTPREIAEIHRLETQGARYGIVAHPAPILRHMDLIDTPGTSDPNMPADTWRRMLGYADAMVWCTNATQAWRQSEKAVWQEMPEALRENATLVITHADRLAGEAEADRVLRRVLREAGQYFGHVLMASLIEPEDIEVIAGHLRAIVQQLPTLPGAENATAEAAALQARQRAPQGPRQARGRPIAVRAIKVVPPAPQEAAPEDAVQEDAVQEDVLPQETYFETAFSTSKIEEAGTDLSAKMAPETAPPEVEIPESGAPEAAFSDSGTATGAPDEATAEDAPEDAFTAAREVEPAPDFSAAFRLPPRHAPETPPEPPVAEAPAFEPPASEPLLSAPTGGRAAKLWARIGAGSEHLSPAEILARVETLVSLLDAQDGSQEAAGTGAGASPETALEEDAEQGADPWSAPWPDHGDAQPLDTRQDAPVEPALQDAPAPGTDSEPDTVPDTTPVAITEPWEDDAEDPVLRSVLRDAPEPGDDSGAEIEAEAAPHAEAPAEADVDAPAEAAAEADGGTARPDAPDNIFDTAQADSDLLLRLRTRLQHQGDLS